MNKPADDHPVSHYERLGIPMDADVDAIKRAYRAKIARHHPDRTASATDAIDNTEMVHALNMAYETLKDPAARARYDASLVRQWRGQTLSVIRARLIRAAQSTFAYAQAQADVLLHQAREKLAHLPSARVIAEGVGDKARTKLDERFGSGFSADIADKLGGVGAQVRARLGGTQAGAAKLKDADAICTISLVAAFYGGVVQVNHAGRSYQLTLPAGVTDGDMFNVQLGDNPAPVRLGLTIDEPNVRTDERDVHYQVTLNPIDADNGTEITLPPPLSMTLTLPPRHRYPANIVIDGRGIPMREGKAGEAGDLYVAFQVR